MQCSPSLEQVESYPTDFLRLILTTHGIRFDDTYDRYDLLALALYAYKFDCPKYTKEQINKIRNGEDIAAIDPDTPPAIARLIPLQRECVEKMREISKRHYVLLNTSDPGTGKTLMSLAYTILEQKKAYIITKRNIVASWIKTLEQYNVTNVVGITSYELGIRAKEYTIDSHHRDGSWRAQPVESKYIRRTKTTKKRTKKKDVLSWSGLRDTVIIFDEPHNSKNTSSFAHDLLESCFDFVKRDSSANNTLLLLGATPLDKIQNLGYLEHVLEIKREQRRRKKGEEGEEKEDSPFIRLNKILYDPDDPRATRVSKDELETQLGISPPVSVTIQAYAMSKKAERVIEEQNQIIADLIRGIRSNAPRTKLKEIQDARRIIELQKVPTFVNLAVNALNKGRSVIIFVEYHASSKALADELAKYKPVLFTGETPMRQRQNIIDAFQAGEFNLLIAHHAVAREGISLHDIIGGHPRTVIISPVWGGITFIQVLGRADRLCRLSDTEQLVVYAQSTDPDKPGWDARVAEVMANKIRNIKELNVGEKADDFMKSLYEGAESVKKVDYAPKVVKLSSKRIVNESQESEAEAEFVMESGLSLDVSD